MHAREEVAMATARWAEAFAGDDPDLIVALYAPDAVPWGTVSPTIRQGRPALREYFEAAFEALPGHEVSFGGQLIRVYGTSAVNSGDYAFRYVEGGETCPFPARCTFVLVKGDRGWLIVDHHSSAMPAPVR
jgi:uncharacterized protein (TIGR02246 family)